jgi:phospho-N-acetylmuramoyl-pentapeptide-transferase
MFAKLVISALVGFLLSAVLGRILLPVLRRLKAGQSIKEDGPTWHISKQGTPTMGGLMFILATTITVVLLNWCSVSNGDFTALFIVVFALVFGVIGFIDDYAKVKKKENTGLSAGQKLLLQLAAAILFVVLLRNVGILTPNLYVPFIGIELKLSWMVYMIFAALVMVGTVNAVNITDGVDGLATGVTMPVCAFFVAVATYSYVFWNRTGGAPVAIFAGALFGSLAGFLLYNFHPAKIFMGDTGSLFLGGAVCGMAFAMDMPLILVLVGIIYVVEALSDIIQVIYFKLTRGKRFFRMAPLHHHFEMGGWSEEKLFFIFSGITLLCCVAAYFGVIDRYPVILS